MKRIHAVPGYLRHLACLGTLGACLGVPLGIGFFGTAPLRAQQPAESGISRTYVNNPAVRLPIEIDSSERAQLRGVVLYMKDGPQGAWTKIDQGTPQQTDFVFRAPRDGEYWFRIVAIDNQGRPHPSDLSNLADSVVVVVDVAPPTVDVHYLGASPDGTMIQCDVRDANLDPLQTHFFFQTQDQVWRQLEAVPGRANLFCIPKQAVLTNTIRVAAADLARNTTTRTFNLGELAQAGQGPAPVPQLPPIAPVAQHPIPPAPAFGKQPQGTGWSPPVITDSQTPTRSTPGGVTQVVATGEDVRPSHEANSVRPRSSSQPSAGPGDPTIMRPSTTSDPSTTTSAGTLSRQPAAPTQIVGNPTVFLNYEIENQGASGVGKVEIWATADQCRTWTKMPDEPARKNPAEIRFPGEGVFGVKLVASNGRGYGAEPPQAGDPADCWIEVDMTKPTAAITAVQAGTGPESGVLTVFWKAEDKNLAADGIELLFAVNSDGPWTSIAKNMHNDKGNEGQYRWTPPTQAGAQSYLRLVVRDKAGNTSISQTVQPIPLDDLSRPRVRVLNVTTAPQAAPPAPASLSAPSALRPGIIRPVQATSIPDLTPPSVGPNLGGIESR
jgi:hypothetical protein